MLKRTLLVASMLALTAAAASAQPLAIVVRHAERADSGGGGMASDPELSEAGEVRARRLAEILADVELTAVFATQYKRTVQTAEPTAASHGLTVTSVPSADTAGLAARIRKSSGPVLVVGHSNTVPDIVKALGVKVPVTVEDSEYDHLFIVTRAREVIRLRY
jgi:phosphohistidine phosphatase SixA